ncbi:MAG: hypothetical protein ACON44_02350 [Candidatus Puniceispirillaceae bacterium]
MCGSISRRHLCVLAGSAIAMLPIASFAQDNQAIRSLHGKLNLDAFKNGQKTRLASEASDTVFIIGEDAFLADADFSADITADETGTLSEIQLLSGQLLAALKPRSNRQTALKLPNATASIRGTGFYVNADIAEAQDYICCCYGHIVFDDATDGSKQEFNTSYHNARIITAQGNFADAPYNAPYGHYDDQLVGLEKLVGRSPHWQLPDDKMHFLSPKPLPPALRP